MVLYDEHLTIIYARGSIAQAKTSHRQPTQWELTSGRPPRYWIYTQGQMRKIQSWLRLEYRSNNGIIYEAQSLDAVNIVQPSPVIRPSVGYLRVARAGQKGRW